MGSTKRVAVFGRADVQPGSSEYVRAYELGRLLAASGFVVLTGGYEGVMEAVSRGASEEGGRAEGVVCRAFKARAPNPFQSDLHWTEDLFERTRVLVEKADAYVALDPRTGTLSEVAMLWALAKARLLPDKPLVLLGSAWAPLLASFLGMGIVEPDLLEWPARVSDAREAADAVSRLLSGNGEAGVAQG